MSMWIIFTWIYYFVINTCIAREPLMLYVPDQGTIVGREMSYIRTQRIIAYLGVPFALPPVGTLRFSPPVNKPLPTWDGVRNTSFYAPGCLQDTGLLRRHEVLFLKLLPNQELEVNEDCLYLNVFVPYGVPPAGGFATMVWLHPGNFSTGNPALWDPYWLVFKQRVIVVTVSYRLNIMGFFTTMDGEASGNYGLMDQAAALEWVKTNIKLFGGNETNICLFGYGAGAISAGLHLVSPYSEGLFSKVVAMSGSVVTPGIIKNAQEDKSTIDYIADYFGCYRTPTSALLDCLRRVDAGLLMSGTTQFPWGPVIDAGLSNTSRPFIPDQPKNLYERGEFIKIPMMMGYTDMEEALSMERLDSNGDEEAADTLLEEMIEEVSKPDIPPFNPNESCVSNHQLVLDSLLFYYKPPPSSSGKSELVRKTIVDMVTDKKYGATTYLWAGLVSKHVPDTFVYRFDLKLQTEAALVDVPEWVTVPHLFDLIYIWGMPYMTVPFTWEASDKRISDIVMNFWANFAKESDPTKGGIYPIRWERFSTEDAIFLIIDRSFNMSDTGRVDYKAFQFWNEFYPKLISVATQCCNNNTYDDDGVGGLRPDICVLFVWFVLTLCTIEYFNFVLL